MRFIVVAICPLAALVLSGLSAIADGTPERTITRLLHRYFKCADDTEQRALLATIERQANGDWATVAAAVREVDLWSDLPAPPEVFTIGHPPAVIRVGCRYPASYDPAKRHPALLCLTGSSMPPGETFAHVRAILGGAISDFVLMAPDQPVGGTFCLPPGTADYTGIVLHEARRRIHLDTDRVFLFGVGVGADAAWMAAINHPDLFAGVIALSGYPRVPYPEQVYPFLLDNLKALPVLNAWWVSEGQPVASRARLIDEHNRMVIQVARDRSLPIADWLLSSAVPEGLSIPQAVVKQLLSHRRAAANASVWHWFRYPGHGDAGWLVQTKFQGDVWRADQLSILPSPAVDYDEFVTDVIQAKMAFVGGRIDGQTVRIETRRCGRIDVLLGEGCVDFDKPVTVICNGRRRCEEVLRPSVATLLGRACRRWEFQRLTAVELSFSIKADTRRHR